MNNRHKNVLRWMLLLLITCSGFVTYGQTQTQMNIAANDYKSVNAKDHYILIANNSSISDRRLIKRYGVNSFSLTYECKCYTEYKNDIVFIYDERHRGSKLLVNGSLPNTTTLDEFVDMVNQAYDHGEEPDSRRIYLVELINHDSYLLYRGANFLTTPFKE